MIMDENSKEQEMMEMFENSFIQVTTDYLDASAKLAQATGLCGDDPIKQEMISFIHDDFVKMCARSEGIRLMAEGSYDENREFIIAEMKEVTILNLKMAEQVKKKLANLSF
tara:strand:+ start:387 stop:719 length:333 start_codon:yes stop_codon:yes gene_type:complete